MEASTGPLILPNPPKQPSIDHIKRKLINHGINPTPKILHNIRKKELQKSNRRIAKQTSSPLPDAQFSEELHFQTIKSEYKNFTKSLNSPEENRKLVGKPWEGLERLRLRELVSDNDDYIGEKLNPQHLMELSDIIECEKDKFLWILDNDVDVEEAGDGRKWTPRKRSEPDAIKLLVSRLSETELSVKDWKFSRIMRYSGLQYTEGQMLKIVERLGGKGKWKHALSVVEWVYNSKEHRHFKSRFVYTKLLAVLGRARKPREALRVFNLMRGDAYIYPDMAAYHSLAVTLGQVGCLKELLNVISLMKEKPKRIRNMKRKNWDPMLQPDFVIFNAVLNACVSTRQWKGVSWVFQQLRKNGLRPNGTSYGLAMEVMLQSAKYDLVHVLFDKMKKSGEALKALTYKVLVKAFWEEGKVNEAVQAVRDMERRGVVGTASVYYELARCLCFHGRWLEAITEIEKLRKLHLTRSLAVTFTGMILSSMDGGHVDDCISIFHYSKNLISADIGLINAMLKVYGRNDMFLKAKELFEEVKISTFGNGQCSSLKPDAYTFGSMLEASACAHQWEYFEYVYKEMILSGYQLDQNKHSVLLVEAGRAGKLHLLQHAFDTILEGGEIPSVLFFNEMICQSISRHDYDRALTIINTMAHAPFQVTFQEWIDLVEMNKQTIDRASVIELQKTLNNHDVAKEATVLNLSRALKFICESSEDKVSSTVSESPIVERVSIENLESDLGLNFLGYDSDYLDDFEGDSDSDEVDFDVSGNEKSKESSIPSASEILESWKELRKGNGNGNSPLLHFDV